MSNTNGRSVEILLVEDNPGDIRLTLEALKDIKVLNQVSVAKDGVEALAFLRREGKYREAVRPDLILLDLNLPKKDGREVLEAINTKQLTDDEVTGAFRLPATEGSKTLLQVAQALEKAHLEPEEISLHRPSLDDVFLAVTGVTQSESSQEEVAQ